MAKLHIKVYLYFFTQSIHREIQNLGLETLYPLNEKMISILWKICRFIVFLAYKKYKNIKMYYAWENNRAWSLFGFDIILCQSKL